MTGRMWLGDALRCFAVLGPKDDHRREEIARLLGLAPDRGPAEPFDPADVVPPPEPSAEPEPVAEPQRIVELIEPLPPTAGPPPATVVLAPTGAPALPAAPSEPCDWFDPLLDDVTAERLLRTSLRTWSDGTAIDVRGAVRLISSLQPPARIPRRGRWALRRGAHVLVDDAPALIVFAADRADLVRRARRFGRSGIAVIRFRHLPTLWGTYVPPARKAPVLAITHLGIGGPPTDPWRATAEEWSGFARMLARRQSPLAVLVPYQAARVPETLRRQVDVFAWDRSLRVPRRARTRGHRWR